MPTRLYRKSFQQETPLHAGVAGLRMWAESSLNGVQVGLKHGLFLLWGLNP